MTFYLHKFIHQIRDGIKNMHFNHFLLTNMEWTGILVTPMGKVQVLVSQMKVFGADFFLSTSMP